MRSIRGSVNPGIINGILACVVVTPVGYGTEIFVDGPRRLTGPRLRVGPTETGVVDVVNPEGTGNPKFVVDVVNCGRVSETPNGVVSIPVGYCTGTFVDGPSRLRGPKFRDGLTWTFVVDVSKPVRTGI